MMYQEFQEKSGFEVSYECFEVLNTYYMKDNNNRWLCATDFAIANRYLGLGYFVLQCENKTKEICEAGISEFSQEIKKLDKKEYELEQKLSELRIKKQEMQITKDVLENELYYIEKKSARLMILQNEMSKKPEISIARMKGMVEKAKM